MSVVGAGVCRLFRLEAGNALKPVVLPALSKREGQAFTCHAWLLDNDAKEALVRKGSGFGAGAAHARGTRCVHKCNATCCAAMRTKQ